jgi:hypothetical protein
MVLVSESIIVANVVFNDDVVVVFVRTRISKLNCVLLARDLVNMGRVYI